MTDETYFGVRGTWIYLYRAVDRDGKTFDFKILERCDTAAAQRFSNAQLAQTVSRIVLRSTKAEPIGLAYKA